MPVVRMREIDEERGIQSLVVMSAFIFIFELLKDVWNGTVLPNGPGLWRIPCATFGRGNWPGQVRSRNYDIVRVANTDRFFINRIFNNVTCCLCWNGDIVSDLCQNITKYDQPLTLCLDLSKCIQVHSPWLNPYIPGVAKLTFWKFSELLRPNNCSFLNGIVQMVSWPLPMSITSILSQFALRDFSSEGDSPFQNAIHQN